MATFESSSSGALAIKTDQPQCFHSDTHSAGLLMRLQGRRDLCDVVLIASGKRISAHRLILVASSDYFSHLLSEPKGEFKVWERTLNDMDGDALEKLVNFCYTGSLELRVDTIKTMLITANYLQFKEITEACCEFFLCNLQPANSLHAAFFAEQLNLEALLPKVKKIICEHFEEVSQHPDFFLLNAKQLSEFIASDDLHVPSEEFLFQVLMEWIEFEPETRRKHFTELLVQVRLHLLSTAFLTEKVEPLCDTMESQKLVLNTLKSRLLSTSNLIQPRKSSTKSVVNQPRNSSSKRVVNQPKNPSSKRVVNQRRKSSSKSSVNQLWAIFVQKTTPWDENLSIAGYDLRTKKWTLWDTPIEGRSEFAVTLLGKDLIVVGGSSNDTPINTVTKLNVHTMASSEMAPMRTSRKYHAVAVLKGAIYAIGGWNGCQDLNSVERWDPVNRIWNFIPVMRNAHWCPAVAVFNNRLYVSGGYHCGKSVECYDPVKNTWRFTAPMKVGRRLHCLAAHKGYLFAIGGNNVEGVERYDPRTDTWTWISCSPNIYYYARCASIRSELFIYNSYNSEFYTISSEGSCDNLKLQTLEKPSDTSISFECKQLIAIP